MAKADANDTRRGQRTLTRLQQARVEAGQAGQKPKCGSPLAGSNIPGHANYNKGKTCQLPAGNGTDHVGYGTCSRHAGNMKAAKVGAAREYVATVVHQYRRFYGQPAEIGFEHALLEELQRTVGVVRWMEDKIGSWGQDWEGREWVAGESNLPDLMEVHSGFRSMSVSDSEFAAWLRMYQIERRHLAQVAKAGIDSGIAKSMVLVFQTQADNMHRILATTLDRLGIGEKKELLPRVLPEVIREITGSVRA